MVYERVRDGQGNWSDVLWEWDRRDNPSQAVWDAVRDWFQRCQLIGPPAKASMLHLGRHTYAALAGWEANVWTELHIDEANQEIVVSSLGY